MPGQSSLCSEANPDPRSLWLSLLDLREVVPRGHGLHLPVAEEVHGQDVHEHAGAGQGGDGQGDQHDQHSLAVRTGMGWEGRGGPGPICHPRLASVTTQSRRVKVSTSSRDLASELQGPPLPSATQCPDTCLFCSLVCNSILRCPLAQSGPCQPPGPNLETWVGGRH